MEKLKFIPPGKSPEEISAGVWYPRCFSELCRAPSGLLATWWPSGLPHHIRATANEWTFGADKRYESGAATGEEIRAEYLAKLAEVCAESNRLLRAEREDYLARSIPPEYRREIDRVQLKNPDAFDKVQTWTPAGERPSLIVFGDTGRGKTRAVFHRLATLHRERGTRFLALTADELKRQLIAAALNSNTEDEVETIHYAEAIEFHRREPSSVEGRLRAAEIAFVDDLSQAKLTPHYAERFFALVEHRMARGLPLIVTTQLDGNALARKLAGYEDQFADTAACLVRRLRDFCAPVNFGFDAAP